MIPLKCFDYILFFYFRKWRQGKITERIKNCVDGDTIKTINHIFQSISEFYFINHPETITKK